MSETSTSLFVCGAPVRFLVDCYRYRMPRRLLILSFPANHSAEVIQLSACKASRALPN